MTGEAVNEGDRDGESSITGEAVNEGDGYGEGN